MIKAFILMLSKNQYIQFDNNYRHLFGIWANCQLVYWCRVCDPKLYQRKKGTRRSINLKNLNEMCYEIIFGIIRHKFSCDTVNNFFF